MRCFVIMPYREELHYMYLFLKRELETEFPGLTCERADKQAMTGLLTDNIARSINSADVVIADCTGANPNVFYELGMAHALDKTVVLLTADPPEGAPTDIRGFEFIMYRLDDERSIVEHLVAAVQRILGPDDNDYEFAKQLLVDYSAAMQRDFTSVPKAEFDRRVLHKLAPGDTASDRAEILLQEVIENRLTIDDAVAMREWASETYGGGQRLPNPR